MTSLADMQTYMEDQIRVATCGYPALFQRILEEWGAPDTRDSLWLLYAASYLFRGGGTRWALDPLLLNQRLPSAPPVDITPLAGLDFVLLTHRHADHLDLNLIRALRDAPIRWVIPAAIYAHVLEQTGLFPAQVVVPTPLQPLELGGVCVTAFDGLHWGEPLPGGGRHGMPATGYLIEFNGKRWLFPGDTRTYDASQLPDFGVVDGVMAHVWLGRAQALEPQPPLLEDFCRFCLDLHPRRLLLAHLHEFGRAAHDYWDERHAAQVLARLHELAPGLPARAARMGERVEL
jgi:hypothetical protein